MATTATNRGKLLLSCGDVPLFVPDQQDKRWREQSLRGNLTFQSACATGRQQHAPDGLWISRICVLEHGVCREFTPVFAKHLRSFWLIDSLAIGVVRMKRNFGPMQKKGEKGEH